ncbi:MAG: transcriptional repressor NrdR [Gemmatimonadetes bacterium]|jgi:transcriptional repressor NrdR|nr:transcriptional repressor NrdR [Rhodospirillales bacterium]MBT4979240.1 transcriptional repressor NrdR [Gemmatimonadota bacterium]MDE0963990.1 transcriptional regulator NrdR [Candidatus Latescibacterota bacterium]MBT5326410.1 transcriptional repressor NrdR [Gemmatimonadota bacterium]MBT5451206.1 transcriptional repressor NrdR [Gemmatimonadota bacterium]
MRCPYCNHEEDRVVDSRSCREGMAIRRRRECLNCSKRFTTYEYIENVPLSIIKSDGRREPFDRVKLLDKIQLACYKTTISAEQIEQLLDTVETELGNLNEKEIPAKQIGELVMEHLRGLNDVAYVRFASVYRQFKDKSDIMRELEQLTSN